MSYLLDTKVVSETHRRQPEPKVMRWLEASAADAHFVSALTVGEITKGIVQRRRRDPAGADQLARWLSGLRQLFIERILVVGDEEAGAQYMSTASPRDSGRSRPVGSETQSAASMLQPNASAAWRPTG